MMSSNPTQKTAAVAQDDRESVTQTVDTLASKSGFVIGVDADGDAHVHYPAAGIIEVYNVDEDYEVGDYLGDDVEHVEHLEGRPLEHWMAYVAHERGEWKTMTHRAPAEVRE